MYGVVNEGGTGGRAQIPGIQVCGKTGTAQVASSDVLKGTAAGRNMKDNSWFVGFAPMDAPEIVVVALFEGVTLGALSAPIVRDVLKCHFDKKARLGLSRPQMASIPPTLFRRPEEPRTATQ